MHSHPHRDLAAPSPRGRMQAWLFLVPQANPFSPVVPRNRFEGFFGTCRAGPVLPRGWLVRFRMAWASARSAMMSPATPRQARSRDTG